MSVGRRSAGGAGAADAFPPDLADRIRRLIADHGMDGAAIVPVLEAVRSVRGALSDDDLRLAGRALGVRPADLREFVAGTRTAPLRRTAPCDVVVCVHRACRAAGAPALLRLLREEWGLVPGGETAGGEVRLDVTECLGACRLAPNVLVDGGFLHGATAEGLRALLEALAPRRRRR
ncbi:MAG TPA: NAD(P)H-dependent oxidoreductase subunit E [Gemmatimonadota bacterium]